jgi:aspartate/methionine/tyrosine aminotransferase
MHGRCVVAIARALRDADAPPHVVRAVAEACASVNARFPLQRFYDIAVGESLRQAIVEYHTKDDEGE